MSFTVNIASEEKELKEIFRLRYKVYCLEWGFEKICNHSDGILTDNYDKHSLHFAARDLSQKLVGALSLILPSEEGFPVEKYCELDIDNNEIPRGQIAEISKLVVHRDYRRRTEDKYIYGPDEERRSIGSFAFDNYSYNRRFEDKPKYKQGTQRPGMSLVEKRKRHEIIISLYKALYIESRRRQMTHWYAIMTKGIVTLLEKFGVQFKAIGDPVDYHGIRTPYLGELRKMEEEMSNRDPELYKEFINGLQDTR
ncbi:MAG: GNAT family N-acetyltransferase [Nitrospiraceae bacterium]|nr:MAG: GNAT family N-acetyltransferase [Nitrospiraceae bacterium]